MSCLAKVILITDVANALTTHLDEISFQRLPVSGEFIYKYDGMAQPAETVYQVVAVLHDVSGHGVTLTRPPPRFCFQTPCCICTGRLFLVTAAVARKVVFGRSTV